MSDGPDDDGTALVLLAKWPGAGRSKTRLVGALRAACAGGHAEPIIQSAVSSFVRSATLDLVERFAAPDAGDGARSLRCVLLYAPPIDEARAWYEQLLSEAAAGNRWRLLPVLSSSDARSSDLGGILADATRRVRAACGCGRVAFMGSDCPELPLASVLAATRAASEARVAAICPASDGGYTLLVLPEEADEEACFAGVHWSAADTCLSQLTALTRAGLRCAVLDTHADVDELEDLQALARRCGVGASVSASPLDAQAESGAAALVAAAAAPLAAACPRTARALAELTRDLPEALKVA